MVSQWMMRISSNPRVILLLVSGMLLITGTFLSEIATIMIFTPLFTRLAQLCGIHPIQMGIVVVMMLCLGLVTPPYGVCLLIAADMADVNLMTATRATLPFIVAFLAIVAIVIFWPDLVLVIPRLVMPRFV
jgi:TRAP-type C4-dicarboxylate transport system permease large subunit